ncbi:MAG: MFS transporter, partial [Nitratireductor sp.]
MPLIQFLLDQVGWRGALIGLGLVNILICAPLYVFAIDPARDQAVAVAVAVAGAADRPTVTGRRAVVVAAGRPVFWALVLALVAYAAAFSILTFHLYPILLEKGLAPAAVVGVIAVIGPAQVAGRVLVWFFIAEAPVRRIGSVAVLAFPFAAAG